MLGRHRAITVVGVIVTVLAAMAIGLSMKPSYEARSSVVLLAPPVLPGADNQERIKANPFNEFGTSHGVVASALQDIMESSRTARQLERRGLDGTYAVTIDPTGGGAILETRVEANTADSALSGLDTLTGEMRKELESRQREAGAPLDSFFTLDVLTPPREAAQLNGSRLRAGGAVLVIGLVATVLAVGAADVLARRRRREADSAAAQLAWRASHRPSEQHAETAPTVMGNGRGEEATTARDDGAAATQMAWPAARLPSEQHTETAPSVMGNGRGEEVTETQGTNGLAPSTRTTADDSEGDADDSARDDGAAAGEIATAGDLTGASVAEDEDEPRR
jgi:hypothetical protein